MKKILLLLAAFAFPAFAFAQANDNIRELGQTVIGLINDVAVPLIFAAAFVVFIWGVFQYFILGGGDEEKREKGRDLMIWGLLGFFFMISVWGLVNLVVNTFEIRDNEVPRDLPNAPDIGS